VARPRVLIDTDPGVDDAVAIVLALASPEIDVVGITAVAGNVRAESSRSRADPTSRSPPDVRNR
jgi:purine nucleosidase